MVRARHRLALLAACLGVSAVAGCAVANSGQPTVSVGHSASAASPPAAHPASPTLSTSQSPSPSPTGVNVAAFHALARHEASAWPNSPLGKVWKTGLVVPLADDLSSGPSGGFPSDETKEAFGNGDLVFTGPPPSGAPDGLVTWPDGTSMKVTVLSAVQVFNAMKNNTGGRCPSCVTTPIAVTAANPTTMRVLTSRGAASVPAWSFTLQGVSTPVIQAALPPGSYVTQYSFRAPTEQLGLLGKGFAGVVGATASADGRLLTLIVSGSPCDTSWGGLVAEVSDMVVVGGWMHNPYPDAPCAASLVGRTVTVQLAKPLGDRVILDAATGWPAPQIPVFAKPVPK
jgi:hypothetical protein